MNPTVMRYNTRRGLLSEILELMQEPVPAWLGLICFLIAFGACFQLVGARHELRRVKAQWEMLGKGAPKHAVLRRIERQSY